MFLGFVWRLVMAVLLFLVFWLLVVLFGSRLDAWILL